MTATRLAVLASAVAGAAAAARTAATNIHRKARPRLTSAKKAIGRADMVIFLPIFGCAAKGMKQYVE
jgi:hypothetical protein